MFAHSLNFFLCLPSSHVLLSFAIGPDTPDMNWVQRMLLTSQVYSRFLSLSRFMSTLNLIHAINKLYFSSSDSLKQSIVSFIVIWSWRRARKLSVIALIRRNFNLFNMILRSWQLVDVFTRFYFSETIKNFNVSEWVKLIVIMTSNRPKMQS